MNCNGADSPEIQVGLIMQYFPFRTGLVRLHIFKFVIDPKAGLNSTHLTLSCLNRKALSAYQH